MMRIDVGRVACRIGRSGSREQSTIHKVSHWREQEASCSCIMLFILSFNPPVRQASGHGPTHLQAKIHYLLTAFETFTLTQYN